MSYSIYERLGFANAAAAGFPTISPELEKALGALDNGTAVKVLRCLDPLSVAEVEVSGRAVFGLLGYTRYEEFVRAMIGREGRVGQLKPLHYKEFVFEDAFARLASTHRNEALASLAAAEAAAAAARQEREEALATLAAQEAAARLDPLGCNPAHLPASPDANYTDNHDFKRLTRAFTYLCVDTLYAQGTRCANTFTGMILAVTNVHLTLPTADVSNIIATTALQRAIKERIRLWTSTEPDYSTDMTTRQLYTFCTRYLEYMQERAAKDVPQVMLNGLPLEDPNEPVEMSVWVEHMERMYPDMEPLPMGKTVSLDEPLAARGEQLPGQTKISLYVNKGRLGRSLKRRRCGPSVGEIVVVVNSSESESE